MSVNINPASTTVQATRTLRQSGNSAIVTIPPEVLQSLDLEPGTEMKITGDWSNGQITLQRVE